MPPPPSSGLLSSPEFTKAPPFRRVGLKGGIERGEERADQWETGGIERDWGEHMEAGGWGGGGGRLTLC